MVKKSLIMLAPFVLLKTICYILQSLERIKLVRKKFVSGELKKAIVNYKLL